MAEPFSVERRRLMRFLGAKVVITPAALRGMGMVTKANELAATHGWFLTRQFENEANADMHSRTTAREIVEDFKGHATRLLGDRLRHRRHAEGRRARAGEGAAERQDRGVRTGGRVDAEQRRGPAAQCGWITGSGTSGLQAASDAGLGADFIPKLTADAVDTGVIHKILRIAGPDALRYSKDLAQKEGIFVGITAGATLAGALQICAEAPKGANVLAMLPDTGERYLSTPLFADIPADMTEEEVQISKSTPTAQMTPPA